MDEVCTMYLVKMDHFMGNLGTNMIDHVSKKELHIILSTLEKRLMWNQTVLITKYQWFQSNG